MGRHTHEPNGISPLTTWVCNNACFTIFEGTQAEAEAAGWLLYEPDGKMKTYCPEHAEGKLEAHFQALTKTWHKETLCVSSGTKIIEHPAYQAIIRLGPRVVPLIRQEL